MISSALFGDTNLALNSRTFTSVLEKKIRCSEIWDADGRQYLYVNEPEERHRKRLCRTEQSH